MSLNLIKLLAFLITLGTVWSCLEFLPQLLLPKDVLRQQPFSERRRQHLPYFIASSCVAFLVTFFVASEMRRRHDIAMLSSIDPRHVTAFKIFPWLSETPFIFIAPDPIIEDFFQSLADLDTYQARTSVASQQKHQWSIEIRTDTLPPLHLGCHIPYEIKTWFETRTGEHVVFMELYDERGLAYGWFQSRLLFQWYQTYSHRWLEGATTSP